MFLGETFVVLDILPGIFLLLHIYRGPYHGPYGGGGGGGGGGGVLTYRLQKAYNHACNQ